MLTYRFKREITALFWLAGTAFAQSDRPSVTDNQPPMPPPWVTPAPAAPGFAPAPAPGAAANPYAAPIPGGGTGDDFYMPQTPAAGGFDDFYDEEDSYYGGTPSKGGDSDKAPASKDSFKIVRPSSTATCQRWGHSVIGPTTFPDKTRCDFELDKKVDRGFSAIETETDKVEFYKLKKVIDKNLSSRAEGKKFPVAFDSLKRALEDASKTGCTCKGS